MAVTGLKSLSAKLTKRIPDEVRSRVRQALAESADEMVGMMKNLAPVGPPSGQQKAKGAAPGALRDSIVASFGDENVPKYAAFRSRRQGKSRHSKLMGSGADPDMSVIITAGNSAVRYAHLVEFGTAPHTAGGKFAGAKHPGTTAQPFFFPAYRALRKRVRARIARQIRQAIKDASK